MVENMMMRRVGMPRVMVRRIMVVLGEIEVVLEVEVEVLGRVVELGLVRFERSERWVRRFGGRGRLVMGFAILGAFQGWVLRICCWVFCRRIRAV